MKTTTMHRTEVSADLTVSTVRIGRSYETTIIVKVNGRSRVCDPVVTTKKSDADLEHDMTVDVARAIASGRRVDTSSKRAARWVESVKAEQDAPAY